MKTRAEIKKDAKRKLNAFWIVPVITVLVVYVLEALIIGMLNDSTLSSIFQVVITTIASVFTTTLFLNIAKNDNFDQVKFSWMKTSSDESFKMHSIYIAFIFSYYTYTICSNIFWSIIEFCFRNMYNSNRSVLIILIISNIRYRCTDYRCCKTKYKFSTR